MDASWGAFLDILEDKSERAGYLSERLRRSPVVLCRTYAKRMFYTIQLLRGLAVRSSMVCVKNARRAFFTHTILDHVSAAGANKRS